MGLLSFLFGKKRGPKRVKRAKRSPGRKPKRDHFVAKLKKSAHVVVRGRKRKLYRGKNGGLYYRSKSGKIYVSKRVLKRRGHLLSPGKGRVRRALKKRKGKKSSAAKKRAARAAYKRRAARMARRMRFGLPSCSSGKDYTTQECNTYGYKYTTPDKCTCAEQY